MSTPTPMDIRIKIVAGVFLSGFLISGSALGRPEQSRADSPPKAAAATPLAPNEEVQRLFKEGSDAAEAKQWPKAQASFGRAFELKPLPQIAMNLGRAELRSGDPLSAAEHFQFYLREEKDPDPTALEAVQALLLEAKTKIVTVTIQVDQADAEVLLDGRPVDKKLLPGPIYLNPGTHTFEAKRTGYVSAPQSLDLSVGAAVGVRLKLAPIHLGQSDKSISATKPMPPPRPETNQSKGLLHLGLWSTGGLALVGLGSVIGVNIVHGQGQEKLSASCSPLADCERQYNGLMSTQVGLAYTSLFSLIGAGAVGTATLVHALTSKKTSAGKPPADVSLSVQPGLGGVIVRGAW